jgi:hypothetical protein
MAKYQRIPEYVEAFQMSEEAQQNTKHWPDWAINCADLDNRQIGAIFPTDPESPANGFSLRTEYGVFAIPVDNWVVASNSKSYMIIQDNHFKAGFIEANDEPTTKERERAAEAAKEKAQKSASTPIAETKQK